MARAIEHLKNCLRVGYLEPCMHGETQGSVWQQVHDEDTVTVRAVGGNQRCTDNST